MKILNLALYDKADNVLRLSVIDSDRLPYDFGGLNSLVVYKFNNYTPIFEVDLTFNGTRYTGIVPKDLGLQPIDYWFEWKNIGVKITFPIKGKLAVSSVYRDSSIEIIGEVTV